MIRGETPALHDQHQVLMSQLSSSNYRQLDIERVYSQLGDKTPNNSNKNQSEDDESSIESDDDEDDDDEDDDINDIDESDFDKKQVESESQTEEDESEQDIKTSSGTAAGIRMGVVDRSPATAGIIEKIVLKNFMCHDNFELELGPQLNFIIGRNGSGKSAILTGISVGLGCKANETDRGKNLKDLIKRGANTCKITITFKNEGDEAFDPENYGNKIIIERVLRIDGVSGYFLRSASYKTISTKKSDLDAILEYFDIAINNPLAFLSQGAARTFIACSSDEDKYQYFMKGVHLQQAVNEYKHSNEKLAKINQDIDIRSQNFEGLHQDFLNSKKIYDNFKQSKNLRDTKRLLSGKLYWQKIESMMSDVETLNSKKGELSVQIRANLEKIAKCNENMSELRENINSEKVKLEEENSLLNLKFGEREAEKNILKHLNQEVDELNYRIKELENQNKEKQKHISKYESKIQVELKKLQESGGTNKEIIRRKIEELKDTFTEKKEQRKSLTNKISEESEKYISLKQDIRAKRFEKTEELSKLHNHREALKKANSDKLLPYGNQMREILRDIENDKGFHHKPIGPMGLYVTIKEGHEQWAPVLEKVLNYYLSGFAVQDNYDAKRLTNILKRHRASNQVVTRKFERFQFDPSHGEDHSQITKLLDILSFENEDVMYTFIDGMNIEAIALEEDRDRARNLVHRYKNLKFCLSLFDNKSGIRLQLNSHTRAFRSDPVYYLEQQLPRIKLGNSSKMSENEIMRIDVEIKSKKLELEEFDKISDYDLKKHRKAYEEVDKRVKALKQETHKINREIEKYESKLEIDSDSSKLEAYKEEMANIQNEIDINNNVIRDSESELNRLKFKFDDQSNLYTKLKLEIKKLEASVANTNNKIESWDERLTNVRQTVDQLQLIVNKKQKIVHDIEAKIPEIESIIEEKIPKADEWCSKEEAAVDLEVDTPESIMEQIKIINQQLNEVNKSLGMSEEQIVNNYETKLQSYVEARDELKKAHKLRDNLMKSLFNRIKAGNAHTQMTCLTADQAFSSSLSYRGFDGKLVFDHEKKRLSVFVGKEDKPLREVSSLSGGEKSYTQIALLLAIWKPMQSKIRGLDEFDVFMDTVNRKVSMMLMLKRLREEPKHQTIFITPQDIGHVKGLDGSDVTIHKLKDPARQNNSENN